MIEFKKVKRAKSKARIAMIGPSGAGKTVSSLYLAYGLTGDWNKVAVIDTEHERARFYASRNDLEIGEFLYAPLAPPYTPQKYVDYVNSATEAVGEDGCVIVDSFSQAWDNDGGVLDIKSQIAQRPGKTDYSAWDEAGKVQNNLVNSILSVPCHTIITMRTKMAYAMEENEKGKMQPVKIGLAPVQRENTEYEFDICFNLARNHIAVLSKDTTFLDNWTGIITPDLGRQLSDFLNKGIDLPKCEECGAVITPDGKRTVEQIIQGSVENYGKQMCMKCVMKAVKEDKKNAAKNKN